MHGSLMPFQKIALFTTVLFASNAAFATGNLPMTEDRAQPALAHEPGVAPAYDIPLIDWSVPQFLGGTSGVTSSMGSNLAAAPKSPVLKLDLGMSVFTAVQPCRLVDTRGLFSPVYAGGPFTAGQIRTYQAAGHCGLPVGSNRIKAISIAITTLPSSISGDVETVPHGTPLGGTVDMVAQAGQWNSVSKIVRVDSNGSFDMQLRFTSGDLAIDINGYYADVNDSNNDTYSVIGTYTVDGGLFYSENKSATGAAVRAFNSAVGPGGGDVHLAQGRNAIDIADGQIRVRNAGIGTSTPAFIHQVAAGNLCTTDTRYTRLDETHLSPPNSSANQMLWVQEAGHSGAAITTVPKAIRTVFLSSFNCTGTTVLNSWYLFSDTAFASGEAYNVLLINP
jgi:hypothetical protein